MPKALIFLITRSASPSSPCALELVFPQLYRATGHFVAAWQGVVAEKTLPSFFHSRKGRNVLDWPSGHRVEERFPSHNPKKG